MLTMALAYAYVVPALVACVHGVDPVDAIDAQQFFAEPYRFSATKLIFFELPPAGNDAQLPNQSLAGNVAQLPNQSHVTAALLPLAAKPKWIVQ